MTRALQAAFTLGLAAAGALLVAGLVTASTPLLSAGILALMLTPALRAVVLTFGLLRERDWTFAAVSLFILLVLGSSAATGMRLAARRWESGRPTPGARP